MRKSLFLLLLAPAAAGTAALAAPAMAAPPAPDCRTAVTHLTDHPDSGNHGQWALDNLTRTVKICETGPAGPAVTVGGAAVVGALVPVAQTAHYHAVVTDEGTFTTVNGHSPNAGVPLHAGTTGWMKGGFTADFVAVKHFHNFTDAFGGDTYHGAGPTTTSQWVQKEWGGLDFVGRSINDDWSWTYWTCNRDVKHATERWTDAADNHDGTGRGAGDITGCACPKPSNSPSASPSPSVSVSPTPTPTVSVSVPPSATPIPTTTGAGNPSQSPEPVLVGVGNSGGGSLPVTGSAPWPFLVGGTALMVAGAVAFVVSRRRRPRFEV